MGTRTAGTWGEQHAEARAADWRRLRRRAIGEQRAESGKLRSATPYTVEKVESGKPRADGVMLKHDLRVSAICLSSLAPRLSVPA